jgi:hypothetical protein
MSVSGVLVEDEDDLWSWLFWTRSWWGGDILYPLECTVSYVSLRNYASFSLQVPYILSILIALSQITYKNSASGEGGESPFQQHIKRLVFCTYYCTSVHAVKCPRKLSLLIILYRQTPIFRQPFFFFGGMSKFGTYRYVKMMSSLQF